MLREMTMHYITLLGISSYHIHKRYDGVNWCDKTYWDIKNSIPKNAENVKCDYYTSGIMIIDYEIVMGVN